MSVYKYVHKNVQNASNANNTNNECNGLCYNLAQ